MYCNELMFFFIFRNQLLELYINQIFQQTFATKKTVYECLCSNFLLYVMDKKNSDRKKEDKSLFDNSWFIFDLVIKSMQLHLKNKNQLNINNKTNLFNEIFIKTLSRLIVNFAKYFKDEFQNNKNTQGIEILNNNLALFISDLFAIFDRGIVIELIKTYLDELIINSNDLYLSNIFRVHFLKIIIDHEHFIPLNFPFLSLSSKTNDNFDFSHINYSQSHPLIYIIISILFEILKSSNDNHKLWMEGISLIYDIIIKHSYDIRYQNKTIKKQIASMYFMIIPLFINSWNDLKLWKEEADIKVKREIFIFILYILKTIDKKLLRKWWECEIIINQCKFLSLLDEITKTFEYSPNLQRETKNNLTPEIALLINKSGNEDLLNILKLTLKKEINSKNEDKRLRLLTIKIHTNIIDLLELFLFDFKRKLKREIHSNLLMSSIVKIYCSLLKSKISFTFMNFLYSSLRIFSYQFSNVLFKGNNNYLYLIIKQILIHCNIKLSKINIKASAFLFILIKINSRIENNFERTNIHSITTLSNLIQNKKISNELIISNCFKRLSKFALFSYSTLDYRDISSNKEILNNNSMANLIYSNFTKSIQDMSFNLINILHDTLRILEITETADNRLKSDLYYQLAENYKDTPDLKLSWLEKLGLLHEQNLNFAEAGIAFTHCSALIAYYLIHDKSSIIDDSLINFSTFTKISPIIKTSSNHHDNSNSNSNSNDSNDSSNYLINSTICHSPEFSPEGFIKYIRFAIRCFKSAELFEFAVKLFNLICPLYEEMESYHELSVVHTQIQVFWNNVNCNNEERLFGQYFRIKFFGSDFDKDDQLHNKIDNNNHEYVYKEPKFTHMIEVLESLKNIYSKRFSKEIFHLDSTVDCSQIDPDKCYIQITKVYPHIEDERKKTFFNYNVNLSEFTFETPFTIGGKAYAENAAEQYKKKTIITVSGSFPSILTHLPVIGKREVIITPIENAVEDIEKRNLHLSSEITKNPINIKTFTQVLQGSALPRKLFLYLLKIRYL